MDIDTVETCWAIFQRYIKSSDESHAVGHLVSELIDAGIKDEDLSRLAAIDEIFAEAVKEHSNTDEDEYWYDNDEGSWE